MQNQPGGEKAVDALCHLLPGPISMPCSATSRRSAWQCGYDLVVSSESGPAKGVLTSSSTRHICYCHTPMRYLWDLYPAYRNEYTGSRLKRSAAVT